MLLQDSVFNKNSMMGSKLSQKDKENISVNEHDLSLSDLKNKRTSFGGPKNRSNSSSKHKTSLSPQKSDKDKVVSLEYRLMGANKAIKALESELKAKNEKIKELNQTIAKKNKMLESCQSNSFNESQIIKSTQVKDSLTTIMRKKEKEMEKKMKEQEIMFTENKKYMTRLQELNSKLLNKIKELEEENLFLKTNQDVSDKVKAYEDENKKLKEKVKALERDNSHFVKQTNSQQLKIKNLVDMYGNFERKSEKFIQKNKTMTDTLLSIISMHNEMSSSHS